MSKPTFLTSPPAITGMPPGIPYIVGNEAAERFSFYGMRAILAIYLTKQLLDVHGQLNVMNEAEAREVQHLFITAVYFFPILGALLSDGLLGKYRTIISLSVVYCLGHLVLALQEPAIAQSLGLEQIASSYGIDPMRLMFYLGLGLIALGSGGIKPCVSAHVGDQFGQTNKHLLEKVFGWFYFSINLGAAISSLLTPWLRERFGPHVAFGVPGVLMFLATVVFWLGRNKFVHIPAGGTKFFQETFSRHGLLTLGKLCIVYFFVTMFWSLFDQTSSAWVLQADKMDRMLFGHELLPDQIQAANPVLIMLFIPLFAYVVYPFVGRFVRVTPLRKISCGLFITVTAFALTGWLEQLIQAGLKPHIVWQLLAYVLITAAEIMVSITVLEFSYTQAPKTMKSSVMALELLSISAGNLFTALVNRYIQLPDGTSRLPGADYYWFFTGMMLVAAIGFIFVAIFYRERTYIQDEQPAT